MKLKTFQERLRTLKDMKHFGTLCFCYEDDKDGRQDKFKPRKEVGK